MTRADELKEVASALAYQRTVGVDKRIEELEQENAELKVRLNAINLLTPELEKMSKLKKQQLTKATEIIKELLNSYKYVIRFREYANKKPIADAEQFLKDLEKVK